MLRTNELGFIEIVGNYNFPPGYRLVPTDREALEEYVFPMVNGEEKYHGIINTVDIYQYEPQDLPGFHMQDPSFYFTPRDANGSRTKRTIIGKNGFWRSNNKINLVKDSDGVVLGRKNTLVYTLKDKNGIKTKTDYLMVEYVLDDSCCKSDKLNDVVLCKIYLKKTSKAQESLRLNEEEEGKQQRDESLNPYKNQAPNEEQWYQQIKVPLDCQDNNRSSKISSEQENNTSWKDPNYNDQNNGCEFERKREESIPPNLDKVFEMQTSKRPILIFNHRNSIHNQRINVNVPTALKKTEIEGTGSSFTSSVEDEPEKLLQQIVLQPRK